MFSQVAGGPVHALTSLGPTERWLAAKPAPPGCVCVAGARSRHSVFFLPGEAGGGWLGCLPELHLHLQL